jgi:hypothetical protein
VRVVVVVLSVVVLVVVLLVVFDELPHAASAGAHTKSSPAASAATRARAGVELFDLSVTARSVSGNGMPMTRTAVAPTSSRLCRLARAPNRDPEHWSH